MTSLLINYHQIKKIIQLILISIGFAFPVFASVQIESESYSDNFIQARNAPIVEIYNPNSCISYGKWRVDVPQSERWGNASQIVPNAQKATVGVFVLTNEGNGHIAYIEAVEGNSMTISESNYFPGEYSTRSLDLSYPLIRGYWKP